MKFYFILIIGLSIIRITKFQDPTSTSSTSATSTASSTKTSQTTLKTTTFVANLVTNIFWVQSTIIIQFTENLLNLSVTADLETRLSSAYSVGYNKAITSGRKKRAAINGVNTLYLVSATRPVSTQTTTTLVYYVQAPDFVSPSTVANNMNQLNIQEMSIIMGRPVTVVAQLYNAATQSLTTDNKLWIFGAVFGSLAGAAFLIWLVLFIHRRCLIPYDEPLLAAKSSIDMESHTDIARDEEEELETIKSELHKNQYSEVSNKYVGARNYDEESNDTQSNTEHAIENEMYGQRVPQEIIVKHVYENRNYSEYRRQRSSSYGSRYFGQMQNSETKKHRKKRKLKIEGNEIEIKSDIAEQQSASLQATPMTNEDTFIEYLDSKVENNIIVVRPLEDDEQLSQEDQPVQKGNKTKSVKNKTPTTEIKTMPTDIIATQIEDETIQEEDNNVIYPIEFVDKYPISHIYPIYPDELVIPDTTLNLIQTREMTRVETDKINFENVNSKKKNMRTIDPTSVTRSK